MEINGKVYRNLPQQVLKNQEDILALKSQTLDAYTKAESDAKFETKEVHQADFDELSSETDTLNQQMATADTDIKNLKKVSGTQATAISTLQADFNALSSETDTLNQQMATANTDIKNLKKVSGTQETAISTLQADVERIDPIVPTDIAVHEGKLGLEHDTVWLTNQSAINLGANLTYDAVTNTLDSAPGGSGVILRKW